MRLSLSSRINQSGFAHHLWLFTAVIGLTITGLGFGWSITKSHDREAAVFDFRSQTHVLRLQQTLKHAQNTLLDFGALVGTEFEPDAEHPLTYDELVNFTKLYKRQHPMLDGLAWSQLTDEKDYPALVEDVRDSDVNDVALHFTAPDDMHNTPLLPVLYAAGEAFAAGVNLSDQPHLIPLIRAAMAGGQSRAWIEPGNTPRLRLMLPVKNSHGRLAGFALGAWNLQSFLESGIAHEPVAGINISLLAPSAGMHTPGEVYRHASRNHTTTTVGKPSLSQSVDWYYAGLPMTFTVSSTPYFFRSASISHFDAWLILMLGLLLSGLAARHLYRHARFTELLELEIDRQTEEIINKETRFQHLMGEIPDAIGVHQHGRWIYVNPAAVQTFAAAGEEELLQSNVLDRVHPDDRSDAARRIRDEIHAGRPAPLKETRLLRMDGSMFYGEVQGRPFSDAEGEPAILVVMRDISERKQAQQELVRLRMAISQADDVMFITDANGRMTYANAACLKEFGINDQEWRGKYAAELRGGAVHDDLYEEITSTLNQGLSIQREVTFTDTQGEERIVWRKMSPVMEDGRVTYHVCVDHDLTEQRRIQGKMESSHRLESLGVMAGGIAHDFNNLLAAIVGNAGLIARKAEPDSGLQTYVQRINDASEQAAGLCRQMQAYAGNDNVELRPITLHEAIRDIDKLMGTSIPRGVTFDIQLDNDDAPFLGDSGKIQQLLISLVNNAGEAIDNADNGIIKITSGTLYLDQQAIGKCLGQDDITEGDYIFIEVRDNGCGMDAVTVTRIFEPFFTTKFTGRGLGMPAALGIVKAHKGGIAVNTRPNDGTCISIYLPLFVAPEMAHASQAVKRAEPDEDKTDISVLIIDDDDMIRDMAAEILTEFGIRVFTASDGAEGVEAFEQQRSQVDVVLLDMTMPRMSGEACFKALKAIDAEARIIICSGYSEIDTQAELGDAPPTAFIHKPFHPDMLLDSIRKAAAA